MSELNPAQRRVAEGLIDLRNGRQLVDDATVERIRNAFIERTKWAVNALDTAGETLWVSKHALTEVLACETRWRAGGDFAWTVANAVGTIAHRAAELIMVGRLDGPPADAVDGAIRLLAEDKEDFAQFVDAADPAQRAAMRASAIGHVTSLVDGFPVLPNRLLPRTEQWFKATLGGRTIELNARPDLALGRPSGPDARSLLVDLKTGRRFKGHVDDLRFYALVFMLRWGAPPWRVATYYAPDGSWLAEDVDADVLEAAARRVSDAILRMAEIIVSERPPGLTPNHGCRWCQLKETCEGAAQWALQSEAEDVSFGADADESTEPPF